MFTMPRLANCNGTSRVRPRRVAFKQETHKEFGCERQCGGAAAEKVAADKLAAEEEEEAALERALAEQAAAEKAAAERAAAEKTWVVIGGMDKGILVRAGADTKSKELGRIAHEARLEQLDLEGDRLHYKKISGDGPDTGWV